MTSIDSTKVQTTLEQVDSDGAKLLVVYLANEGAATIDMIQENLQLTLARAYGLLSVLEKKNLIQKNKETYTLAP